MRGRIAAPPPVLIRKYWENDGVIEFQHGRSSRCKDVRFPGGRLFRAACFVLLLISTLSGSCRAQYRSTQWTADSGLPQNSVRGIVQTPDGFLWVATLNGIAKFDGVRFQVFDKSNTPGITTSRFVSMVAGEAGDLWLTSEDGNVVRYHGGAFATLDETSGVHPRTTSAITANRQGGIWILAEGAVLHWIEQRHRFEREAFSTPGRPFNQLWWIGTGFWRWEGNTIYCFQRGQMDTIPAPAGIQPAQLRGLASGADGAWWFGLNDGRMAHLLDGHLEFRSTPFTSPMRDPAEPDWNVSVATNFKRTMSFPSGGIDQAISYNVIVHDNEGNLWVGSESQGLFRIQKQSIRTLTSQQGLSSDNVYPIYHARNGDMWIGSWPAGLSQVRDGRIIASYTATDGLPGLVTSIAEDNGGTLWVGSHGGLRTIVNNHLVKPSVAGIDKLPVVQAMLPRPDGAMLFGAAPNLYILSQGSLRALSTQDGLASNDIRVLFTDSRGDLWVAGYGGVTRISHGQFSRWTETQGLPSNNVRSITEDTSGDIWVGTYDGGIGWLRNGKWVVFNKKRGLFDNGAFMILEDRDGHFWISSNRGIYRVSRKQLAEVADGRESLVNSIAYGVADGMLSVECNGGLWPAGARDSHGLLWFPTQHGVAIVDPEKVEVVRQPPRLAIEFASIEQKPQPAIDRVTLQPGQTNLEINYTALSFTKPEQIVFNYKLDGVDENWEEVGYRRTAYYSHLPPGTYTFRVSARNGDGVASLQDATMMVTVVPPFYRRWWFLALVFFCVLGIIWIIWSYRIRHLKKTQAAQQAFSRELIASQENERRRIAAELHDSLGQRLIIINNLALFLLKPKRTVRTEEDKQQTIEEISSEALQAIEETRAISYALRPFQLDRLGLSKAIQALVKTVARASEIELTADIDNIDEAFAEDQRINFYRIVQEALNNIVKHSHATAGSVIARRTKKSVVLSIEDNGQGMPSEPRSVSAGPGGFGLTGMRERATLLKGVMHIRSDAGAGTLLVIDFPVEKEDAP